MSIDDEISKLCIQADLRDLVPQRGARKPPRRLLVSTQVALVVDPPDGADWRLEARGQIDAYLRGEWIGVGQMPHDKDGDAPMSRVAEDCSPEQT